MVFGLRSLGSELRVYLPFSQILSERANISPHHLVEETMLALRYGFVLLLLGSGVSHQTTVNTEALEKQQQELSKKVTILRLNFSTFWNTTYPEGAPFATQSHEAERNAAAPKYSKREGVKTFNDGLGCLHFITADGTQIPNLCAPIDVRAQLAMEALRREDRENGRSVPKDKGDLIAAVRDSILSLWAEEKTLYCVLRPEAQYIDLNDSLQSCTPKGPQ